MLYAWNDHMNIVLIRPPRRNPWENSLLVPPLGLAYIASAARLAGHHVQILDAYALRWTWQRFTEEMQKIHVDVIGFTAMTPVWDVVQQAIDISRNSARYIVVGGPHPTVVRHEIFGQCPKIDAGIVGEGEESFVALLGYWQAMEVGDTQQVPAGVVLPHAEFREISPPDVQRIAYPARDLLDNSLYRYPLASRAQVATMITSRGCPFRCSFCDKSVGGSRWRARTPVDVVNEMEEIHSKYNVGFINMYDDNFTLHRKRVVDICQEIIRRQLPIVWKCEGRVDSVDLELLQIMKKAGCQMIAFGVESGNPDTLELLRKDITVEQTRHAFALMQEVGIASLAYIILGAPGEDAEKVWQTIRFCREIEADYVQFSSLSAMPGTSISEMFVAENVSVTNMLDADVHRKTLTSLSEEELQTLMNQAWKDFYLRPHTALRLGLDMWRSGYWKEIAKNSYAWSYHHMAKSLAHITR